MTTNQKMAELAIKLMDLTSLNDSDTKESITTLCNQSKTPYGEVAAICIYSPFISLAVKQLKSETIQLATVVNFPKGDSDLQTVLSEVDEALHLGATEIDLVLPYQQLINGNTEFALAMVKECKLRCQDKKLKVIVESGELKTPELIKIASNICIEGGADFIKTSTGKVSVNATLEATKVMLSCIKNSEKSVGIKVAGGVKTIEDVTAYIQQAKKIMGDNWVNVNQFRFGASSLLSYLLSIIEGNETTPTDQSDH